MNQRAAPPPPPAVPATGEKVQDQQRRGLRALLRHVWRHSAFYRDYYASHGIAEKDLPELTVQDLPFVSKRRVMEHFDTAVTDRRLRRHDIERWLQDNQDPAECYQQQFVVADGSGSSGRFGTFVYSRADWQVMKSTIGALRLPPPERGRRREDPRRLPPGDGWGTSPGSTIREAHARRDLSTAWSSR